MRRLLLLLPFGLALGALAGSGRAVSQPEADFGVLRDGPPPATPRLPAGAVPAAPLPAGAAPAAGLPVGAVPAGPAAAPAPAPTLFPIGPEAGPWCICAAHYSGPEAAELARQVALELRNKHRLPAYIMNHGDQERARFEAEQKAFYDRNPHLPRRSRTIRVQEQCAVLIGGFKDFDAASAYLSTVRKLPMPELKLDGGKPVYDTINFYEPDPQSKRTVVRPYALNPFSSAMVVRNPTLPLPRAPQRKFDPIWKTLNADEEYSLLKCPRPWTLLVKEYTGASVIQSQQAKPSSFLGLLGFGDGKSADRLGATAMQAHELARVLRDRRLGFEAYVLHTRTGSVVTVGGFDGPDDPALLRMQQRLAALKFGKQGGGDPIGLLSQPLPAEVPRP
jgi:hypothetical protein